MATWKHPITGVTLNVLSRKRPNLNLEEAITVWVLHFEGTATTEIAHLLVTNPGRVVDVLQGKVHSEARDAAIDLMKENGALLV